MFYKSLRDPFAARVEYKDQGGRLFSLEEMYFCDGCSMLYSRFDLTEEIESFYCPHCLDNLPSSEAMLYLARCSKCFECPICFNTLCTIVSHDSSCHLSCFYCRWNSRIVGLEANKAEALITMALQREKDSPRKTEMSEIVNIFRKSSQEMAREKELQARIQRRRRSLGMQFPIVEPRERPKGPWRLDHLESKLKERDDLSLIPERKFNRIMVALRVNPLKGCCGKVATCVIQCNLKVKDKAEKDHELTVDMVLSLGGIVNFPGEQLVTETNDQNLCTSYAVSHTTDHGPVPSSVPQASNNTEAPTEKTDSDNVAID
eukprot:GHVL01034276.1.p1 GENE.GHVL01034276.1~~GHVL01034276.1.p1  ORF type:complete len:317 (+),score=38.03 GHVL01034276.1:38-988(+)